MSGQNSSFIDGNFTFGAALASIVQLIPDDLLTSAGKGILFIAGAFVSGFAYKAGQALVADRDFAANSEFFQEAFEIGRRYKIQNPEKMRSEYGKLMYMLMDSSDTHIQVGCWGPAKGGVGSGAAAS